MADSILRLKVESQEYDNKLKQAAQGLTRYADECRKVGGTLEVVEKETLDYVRALGQMDTASRTATGKLAEMKKTFTELSAQYKQMTDAEKQSPFGKALAASLDQLKGRIQDSKSQLDDINKSINGGGGLTGALDAVAGKFGLNIDQVTKFGGVVGVATTAIQVAKDAFFQSESGIDEWGRTVEGAKGAYSVFLDTLNNGNWSNFFQNLSAAIQGGRDLYDVFDRLGSIKSNNAAAIALTQKEIAELRLAKQQGENVDAKLKAATERLAALQKQSVSAGMAAGSQSAFQTIRNGVNSIGGAGVNDATIKYVVDKIMKGGQSEFDKYKRNYETLQQRGMVTRTQTIRDSQGGTYERQYKVFDINALTKEQQKQYAIAKAITEGETRIQKGIAAYAQSVSEGTASAREAFKGNRYALQGSGGGGRSGGGGGKTGTEIDYAPDSIKAQQVEVQRLTKLWQGAGAAVRDDYKKQLEEAQYKLDRMTGKEKFDPSKMKEIKGTVLQAPSMEIKNPFESMGKMKSEVVTELSAEQIKVDENTLHTLIQDAVQNSVNGMDLQFDILGKQIAKGIEVPDSAWQSIIDQYNDLREQMGLEPITVNIQTGNLEGLSNDAKVVKTSFKDAASAVGNLGSALSGLDDPGVKIAGTVAQAIANIALAFSSADLKDGETGNVWYWIAATAAGLATMVSTISSIHAATKYAEGGMIKGNSYSGDNILGVNNSTGELVGLNAGEIVLNRAQQGNLLSQGSGGGFNGQIVGRIEGENIVLVANRYFKRTGQGEILTWKN